MADPAQPSPAPLGQSFDDMLGDDKAKALTADLTKLQEQKVKSDAALHGGEIGDLEKDKTRIKQAYDKEGIGPGDLKPWNADEELAKRSHSPMEEFGSFASVFAIAASAFTHTPATNAMNALAAYNNATRQNDADAYDKAFSAFKENSELMLKRHQIQHEQFEDANKLLSTDMTLWRARTEASASRFGDQRMLAFLRNGMDKEVLDMQEASARAAVGMAQARDQLVESNMKMKYVQAKMKELPPEQQNDPQQYIRITREYEEAQQAKTPEQQLWRQVNEQYEKDHNGEAMPPSLGVEALRKITEAVHAGYGAINLPAAQSEWESALGHPLSPGMASIISDVYSAKGANAAPRIAQVGSALAEIKDRKAKGEDLTPDQEEQILRDAVRQSPQSPAGGVLDDKTADLMAEQYLAGDRTIFTNLGRGAQGAQNVVKVRNSIMKEAKDQGLSGTDIALRLAEYNGVVSGERTLGTRTANIEMFASETQQMIKNAEIASQKVPRGEWVPLNKALLAFERNTGDPNVVALGAALNAVINTYAKAIAGGGQATVSDKDHARDIVEMAYSDRQLESVFKILQTELAAARNAPADVKQQFRNLAGAKNLEGNLAGEQNTIKYDSAGNRVK